MEAREWFRHTPGKREKFTARELKPRERGFSRLGIRDVAALEIERVIGELAAGTGFAPLSRVSAHAFPIGLHCQQSSAVFSLVDFGFSRFQLLIFDQQQIALASEFIRFAKRNIALA